MNKRDFRLDVVIVIAAVCAMEYLTSPWFQWLVLLSLIVWVIDEAIQMWMKHVRVITKRADFLDSIIDKDKEMRQKLSPNPHEPLEGAAMAIDEQYVPVPKVKGKQRKQAKKRIKK